MEILFYSDKDPKTQNIMDFINKNKIKSLFTFISYEKYGSRFPVYIKELPSIYSKPNNKLYERDQLFDWLNNIKNSSKLTKNSTISPGTIDAFNQNADFEFLDNTNDGSGDYMSFDKAYSEPVEPVTTSNKFDETGNLDTKLQEYMNERNNLIKK